MSVCVMSARWTQQEHPGERWVVGDTFSLPGDALMLRIEEVFADGAYLVNVENPRHPGISLSAHELDGPSFAVLRALGLKLVFGPSLSVADMPVQ